MYLSALRIILCVELGGEVASLALLIPPLVPAAGAERPVSKEELESKDVSKAGRIIP